MEHYIYFILMNKCIEIDVKIIIQYVKFNDKKSPGHTFCSNVATKPREFYYNIILASDY